MDSSSDFYSCLNLPPRFLAIISFLSYFHDQILEPLTLLTFLSFLLPVLSFFAPLIFISFSLPFAFRVIPSTFVIVSLFEATTLL